MRFRVFLLAAAVLSTATGAARAQTSTPPGPGLLPEPRFVTWAADRFANADNSTGGWRDGPYVRFGDPMPGAGWLAVGPGYRHSFFAHRVLADVSSSVSWRTFLLANGRLEMPDLAGGHVTVGTELLWQDATQMRYYGIGPATTRADASQYRLRAHDASAYLVVRAGNAFTFGAREGRLSRPSVANPTGWHDGGSPSTFAAFTDISAPGLARRATLDHTDLALAVNTLDQSGHPTDGTFLMLGASDYRDRQLGEFSFRLFDLQLAKFVRVSNAWTLAVRLSGAVAEPVGDSRVPFYMLPRLGKQSELRAYDYNRFHDRAVAVANVESRWALFEHVDAAVFADVGDAEPRPRVLGAHLKTSYGFGLGLHTRTATVIRIDLARGAEGWRWAVKLVDPLTTSLFRRWATIVPITP